MSLSALLFAACVGLSGCSAGGMAGAAIGAVLEAGGLIKRDGRPRDLSMQISAGLDLNRTSEGIPMSLVTKIYVLRSPERLRSLTYEEAADEATVRSVLGDDLISARELIMIPGKTYDMSFKIPGEAGAIAIIGLYRAPYRNRWRLAFDAQESVSDGIVAKAHACAFSVNEGILITDLSPETVRTLDGVSCDN